MLLLSQIIFIAVREIVTFLYIEISNTNAPMNLKIETLQEINILDDQKLLFCDIFTFDVFLLLSLAHQLLIVPKYTHNFTRGLMVLEAQLFDHASNIKTNVFGRLECP